MRQIITEKDIKQIIGKFIIQLNEEDEHIDITKGNVGFWLEKRISFVGYLYGFDGAPHIKCEKDQKYIILNGLYYTHGVYTIEEFSNYFNYGYKGKRKRFHRLLTKKELKWLFKHLRP